METSIFDLMEEVRRRINRCQRRGNCAFRADPGRSRSNECRQPQRSGTAECATRPGRADAVYRGSLKSDFEINASLFDPVKLPTLEELRQEVPGTNPDVLRLQAESEPGAPANRSGTCRRYSHPCSSLQQLSGIPIYLQPGGDERHHSHFLPPPGRNRCGSCRIRASSGNAGISPLRDWPTARIGLAGLADSKAQGGDVRGGNNQGGGEPHCVLPKPRIVLASEA